MPPHQKLPKARMSFAFDFLPLLSVFEMSAAAVRAGQHRAAAPGRELLPPQLAALVHQAGTWLKKKASPY